MYKITCEEQSSHKKPAPHKIHILLYSLNYKKCASGKIKNHRCLNYGHIINLTYTKKTAPLSMKKRTRTTLVQALNSHNYFTILLNCQIPSLRCRWIQTDIVEEQRTCTAGN
jgi:hypothetical protein